MSAKKSIFLQDSSVDWIKSTTNTGITVPTRGKKATDTGPAWSVSINTSIEQLRFLLRESLPKLTRNEWQDIINVYAGSNFPAHVAPARIAADIMTYYGAFDIGELKTSAADLVIKMRRLNQAEQLAILYFVQIFLSHTWTFATWNEIEQAIMERF